MSLETGISRSGSKATRGATQSIVFLMAVVSTLLGALYLIGLAGKLIVDGSVHSVSSPSVQVISAIVALTWDVALVVLFVALRRQLAGKDPVFADLAVMFIGLTGATSSMNWFVQLAVLPRIAQGGDAILLALLDVHNTASITYAMEHLGWGVFYGLAVLFMASALGGAKLESWIRWLFVAGGTLSLIHVIGVVTANPALGDLGYLAWGVFLPLTTALLAIRFRH